MAAEPVGLPLIYPTVDGCAVGIIDLDPFTLQCSDCGSIVTGERPAITVILSGYHFHSCEGRTGQRRCPECLAAVVAACLNGTCKR